MIKKIAANKYRLYSHSGKNLGTFNSRKAAENREREVNFFKNKKNK